MAGQKFDDQEFRVGVSGLSHGVGYTDDLGDDVFLRFFVDPSLREGADTASTRQSSEGSIAKVIPVPPHRAGAQTPAKTSAEKKVYDQDQSPGKLRRAYEWTAHVLAELNENSSTRVKIGVAATVVFLGGVGCISSHVSADPVTTFDKESRFCVKSDGMEIEEFLPTKGAPGKDANGC